MDTLTNVNIEDDERTKKSHQNVKDFKEGYKAYDSEVIDEHTGEVKSSSPENILFQLKSLGSKEGAVIPVQGVTGGGEEGEFHFGGRG